MTTATAKKTGWYIRKAKASICGFPPTENDYYMVYIFADGGERTFSEHHTSAADCRRVIRDFFDGGRKAPERATRITAEEAAEILHRTCLSDPF